jgi:hypothetical protein
MILSDGGFHVRSCFLAPDLVGTDAPHRRFNFHVSRARCIVENAIGLLKMKWRRFHKHQIAELTDIIPDLILCAIVLHNICIDAGDVTAEEDVAVRDEDEAAEERAEINAAYSRVANAVAASMSEDAEEQVQSARNKTLSIFDMWCDYYYDKIPMHLDDLRNIYGEDAFAFNDDVIN